MALFQEVSLFLLGGGTYVALEWLWRGFSHPSMFLLGGLCFRLLGVLRRHLPPLWVPLLGAIAVTALDLLTGLVVNCWLGWAVWDYSAQPGNLLGQICPLYTLLWIPLSAAAAGADWLIRERLLPPLPPRRPDEAR